MLAGTNQFLFGSRMPLVRLNLRRSPGWKTAGLEMNAGPERQRHWEFAALVNEYTQQANAQRSARGAVADAGECAPDLRQVDRERSSRSACRCRRFLDSADHAVDPYVNDFNLYGERTGAARAQSQFRLKPEDIGKLYVRGRMGHDPNLEPG